MTFRVAQEGMGLSIGGTSSPWEGQDFGAVSMGPAIESVLTIINAIMVY